MLITCPECQSQISDKALNCIHCGYPLRKAPRQTKKFKKLPNGYGQIKRLSGNRRKPYAVYPPVTEWKENGSPVQPAAIGYYESYNDALEALALFNKNPFNTDYGRATFAEVYSEFFEEKFSKKKYSDQYKSSMNCGFNNLAPLHDRVFRSLKTHDFQEVIDECPLAHSSLELMQLCAKQVYAYAVKNDIVDKDYGKFITINKPDDDEQGVPFTEDEIDILWANRQNKDIRILLLLIYTGVRISELKTAKFDEIQHAYVGGLKTPCGKKRIVPIHDDVFEYAVELSQMKFNATSYRQRLHKLLSELGIEISSEDTVRTPHDARHTFSWLADKYKMDEISKHLIMGHSLGKDVEKTVYSHRTLEELYEEVMKIKTKREDISAL